jgi:hypothetical protein
VLQRKLRRLASKHGGKVVSDFTSNVTHVVTPDENHTARRTLVMHTHAATPSVQQ